MLDHIPPNGHSALGAALVELDLYAEILRRQGMPWNCWKFSVVDEQQTPVMRPGSH